MINYRELARDECALLTEIDRSEIIEAVWHMRNGCWTLMPEHWQMTCFPNGPEEHISDMRKAIDEGGVVYGAFDGGKIAGMAAQNHRFFGSQGQYLEFSFLHVSQPYRHCGIGKNLLKLGAEQARKWGAAKLYISSTPSENTQRFYRSVGCAFAEEINPALYADEPEDVHLELDLSIPAPVLPVSLRPLDVNNWYAVSRLHVLDEQRAIFPVSVLQWIAISRYECGNGHTLYAIELAGFPVGMIGYGLDPQDEQFWITPLMVDGQFQRRGIGRRAMQLMIAKIRDTHHCSCIKLGHRNENLTAQRLYESLGFTVFEQKENETIRCLNFE